MSTSTAMAYKPRDGFFSRAFAKVLENNLPRRFKRLIYVSSILGLMQQARDPDMTLVTKLNDTLKLAQYPDAFAFPMYVKSVIWRDAIFDTVCLRADQRIAIGDLIKQDLTGKDCTAIGEYFASQSPSWLKYGSLEFMVNDVVSLIKQLKTFNGQAATAAA